MISGTAASFSSMNASVTSASLEGTRISSEEEIESAPIFTSTFDISFFVIFSLLFSLDVLFNLQEVQPE